jgi:N-acetylneuraminic acid mutarotase
VKRALLFCILPSLLVLSANAQTWVSKANFIGDDRSRATGFFIESIGKGYIGTGIACTTIKADFWEWDEATNAWTQKSDFGGGARQYAVAFSIGGKGYVGTGEDNSGNSHNDLWEFDPSNNTWTQRAFLPGAVRYSAVAFTIGSKGYIGTGTTGGNNYLNDFYEYDPIQNSWTQKTSFAGTARSLAAGFSIGTKGYIGTGYNGQDHQDFWEWDQSTNQWTQRASFAGGVRETAVAFSIGNKGYMGTGLSNFTNYHDDFWQYDPASNTWTQLPNYAREVSLAVAFASCSKGYIGTGKEGTCDYDQGFREFTPAVLTASQSSFCAGTCISFTHVSPLTPVTYSWSFPGATPSASALPNPTSICYNSPGIYYATLTVSTGSCTLTSSQQITVNAGSTSATSDHGICMGGSTTLTATGEVSYSWSPGGQSTSSITVSPLSTTTYIVTGINASGCSSTDSVTVTVNPVPNITAAGGATVCRGSSATLTASGGGNYAWMPGFLPGSPLTVTPNITTTYTVTGSNSFGCSDTGLATVIVNQPPQLMLTATTPICSGSTLNVSANNVAGAAYSWAGPNGFTSSAAANTIPSATPADSGWYYVTATGSNGCSRIDSVLAQVTQNPTAYATASGSLTFCQGDSVALTATSGSSYLWNTGATTQTIYAVSSGNYSATVTNPNGCSGNATTPAVTVTANPNPATPSIVQNMNVLASTVQGTTYQWYLNGALQTQLTTQFVNISPGQNGIWYVTVTSAAGCSSTSPWFFSDVSIEDTASNRSIDVYPNPSEGKFIIKHEGLNEEISIEVVNMLGETIYSTVTKKDISEIDLSAEPAGAYFIRLRTGSAEAVQKLFIQH